MSAACDALVIGLDTPGLRILAACTRAEADYDVHDLLPAAIGELGLTYCPLGSEAGQEAAARALARRMLAGELTPWEFTFWIHQRNGHELPLTERLAVPPPPGSRSGWEHLGASPATRSPSPCCCRPSA